MGRRPPREITSAAGPRNSIDEAAVDAGENTRASCGRAHRARDAGRRFRSRDETHRLHFDAHDDLVVAEHRDVGNVGLEHLSNLCTNLWRGDDDRLMTGR